MNLASYDFFAYTALSKQQDGNIHTRDLFNRGSNLGHGGASGGKDEASAELLREIVVSVR
jgi:hypothetical protein